MQAKKERNKRADAPKKTAVSGKSGVEASTAPAPQRATEERQARPAPKSAERAANKSGIFGLLLGILIAGAILAALFFAVKAVAARASQQTGSLNGISVVRLGSRQTLVFDMDKTAVKKGDTVRWYVNGANVHSEEYDGEKMEYEYTAEHVGTDHVKVSIGKWYQTLNITVEQPLVTVRLPQISCVYGEAIPAYDFVTCDDENEDLSEWNISVRCIGEPYAVGVYRLVADIAPSKRECEVVEGSLEILPKEVKTEGRFVKEYDGTNVLERQTLRLTGVLSGDDVSCVCDVYFEDKNVGEKNVLPYNFLLQGADAGNYVLCREPLKGEITPKTLLLEEVEIADKMYDGTVRATVQSAGKLKGIVTGDIVAIGSMSADFEDADAGQNKKVRLAGITLVGRDKDNYVLKTSDVSGNIQANYLDILFNRPDVIGG